MERVAINKRLTEMCRHFGIKPIDISKRTGIPKSSISMYFSGARLPRQDKIAIISDCYGINPTWLLGYDVPMERREIRVPNVENADKHVDLIFKFDQLPPEKQELAMRMIDSMLT